MASAGARLTTASAAERERAFAGAGAFDGAWAEGVVGACVYGHRAGGMRFSVGVIASVYAQNPVVSAMAIFRQLWAAHCAVGLARYAGSIPQFSVSGQQKMLQHAKCARAFS